MVDRFAVILVAVAAMLWGTDTLFRAPIIQHLGGQSQIVLSTQIVFMEHLVLTIVCLPMLWFLRTEVRRLTAGEWAAIIAIGVGASALATVLFTISFSYFHFVETLLLQKLQPLFAILLAALWLRERLAVQAYVLIPVALAGAYLVVIPDPGHPEQAWKDFHIAAGAYAVAAAALWGCATVFGRHVLKDVSFPTVTGLRFVTGFPALLVCVLLLAGPGGFTHYRASDVPLYVGVALLPGFLAMLLYYRGLASTPASLATLAELAFPVTGIIVNVALLHQQVAQTQYAGVVVLWVSLAALDWFNARHPARLERGVRPAPATA